MNVPSASLTSLAATLPARPTRKTLTPDTVSPASGPPLSFRSKNTTPPEEPRPPGTSARATILGPSSYRRAVPNQQVIEMNPYSLPPSGTTSVNWNVLVSPARTVTPGARSCTRSPQPSPDSSLGAAPSLHRAVTPARSALPVLVSVTVSRIV